MSVRMSDVDGITKAIHVNGQTTDIAISNRKDLLALDIARLDVDATMKMPRTGLAKVASKRNLVVDGGDIFYIRIADRLGIVATTCQQ